MKPALLRASKACPPVIAPSPITATTLSPVPFRSFATAIPRAAEIEVDECPTPNASCTLSERLGKPDRPL